MLLKPSDLELQSSERYEEWGTEDKACSLFPRWRDQPRVPATKEGPRAPRPGLGEHGAHPPLPQSSSHHSPPRPPQRQRSRTGQGKTKRSVIRKDSSGSISEQLPSRDDGMVLILIDFTVLS